MKKVSWISVIFVCLAALFMIVSCTDPNNPGGSGTGGGGSDPAFLRASTNSVYQGYTEIFFDNYTDSVTSSDYIIIFRRKTGESNSRSIYIISSINGNFTDVPPVIDYYVDSDTTYEYSLYFSNDDRTAFISYEAAAGLGEPTCTQGTATYSNLILTFSTLPVFPNVQIDGYDSSTGVVYDKGYMGYCFDFTYNSTSFLDGNDLNLWDSLSRCYPQSELTELAGQTLTPESYYLKIYNSDSTTSGIRISYSISFPITSGLPDITLPTEWPSGGGSGSGGSDPAFLRASTNSDYQGFNEIYFDNYEEQVKASTYIGVYRGESDSSSRRLLYWIRSEAGEFFECIPPLIDFYAVPGTEYRYFIHFSSGESTSDKKFTTVNGYAPSVTPGNAVFNPETWDIEFSTVPVFINVPVSWFTSIETGLGYVVNYDGTNWGVNLSLGDPNENKISLLDYSSFQGKIMKPEGYYLEYRKDDVGDGIDSIEYTIEFSDTTGIPEFTMPSLVPEN